MPNASVPSSSGVTPPAGSSPGTANGVTPPSGGGGAVTPLAGGTVGFDGNCYSDPLNLGGILFGQESCTPAPSLDTQNAQNDDKTKAATGDKDAQARVLVAEAKTAATLANQKCKSQSSYSGCDDYVLRIISSPLYQSMDYQERLDYLQGLQGDLRVSSNVKASLESQVRFAESHQVQRNEKGEFVGFNEVKITSRLGGNSFLNAAAGIVSVLGGNKIGLKLLTVVVTTTLLDVASLTIGLTGDSQQ